MCSHENSASLRRRLHNEEGEDTENKTTFSYSSRSASTKEGVLRWSEKRVWTFALAFRVANALLVQTYFNPDEHWQSLEVAHRIVFGYGHLTWEWKEGIRSYLHPLLFAFLYRILAFLHLDQSLLMVATCRMLMNFSQYDVLLVFFYLNSSSLYGVPFAPFLLRIIFYDYTQIDNMKNQ